ncbi:hypothetical protein NEFER03_1402 [Nematocida sp. LUAm3]|nr:hypothetical protein NEFER03_1402 [Nematocida sp. LUAm3]KAI5174768.1 hypothetical protein NEFER02_0878 [Nematocida sp. LUAm2]KAI5177821.1 hypothetical protein NEFER01_1023 [Nematocida sp. LUAm1]
MYQKNKRFVMMQIPRRNLKDIFVLFNKVSFFLAFFHTLLFLEQKHSFLLQSSEVLLFLVSFFFALYSKANANSRIKRTISFYAFYLVLLTPIVHSFLHTLPASFLFFFSLFLTVGSFLSSFFHEYVWILWISGGIFASGLVRQPRTCNGFLFLFLSTSYFLRIYSASSLGEKNGVPERALSLSLNIFLSNLSPFSFAVFLVLMQELFFSIVIPFSMCVLYEYKLQMQEIHRRKYLNTLSSSFFSAAETQG